VINNGPRPVSAAARERILAAIDELGWQPDGVARNLRTGKSHLLGLVVPDIGLPYFAEMTMRLMRLAYDRGYQLLVSASEWDADREAGQLTSLASRRVDGIILMSVNPLQSFAALDTLKIPVVIIDRPEVGVRAGAVATRHLIDHGHRHIGLVTSGFQLVANQRRFQGWQETLAQSGLEQQAELIRAVPASRAGGYQAASELFALEHRPTAVAIESDAQAVGFIRRARELGWLIPEEVAMASMEGTEIAQFAVPSLTSIDQPFAQLSEDIIDAILSAHGGGVHRLTNQELHLVVRESCGCTPGASEV
jgi:LacI family transcriptional regulator